MSDNTSLTTDGSNELVAEDELVELLQITIDDRAFVASKPADDVRPELDLPNKPVSERVVHSSHRGDLWPPGGR